MKARNWKSITLAMTALVCVANAEDAVKDYAPAREVIDRTISVYRGLKTYSCTHVRSWSLKYEGDSAPTDTVSELQVRFEAPDKFALLSKDLDIRSDGTSLSIRSIPWKQFIISPAPKAADLDAHIRELTGNREGLPLVIESNMRPQSPVADLWADVKAFTELRDGESAGKPCWWVTAVLKDSAYASGLNIDQRISIDQDCKLMVRSFADFTEAANLSQSKKSVVMVRLESAIYSTTNRDIVVNEPIPAESFVFTPTPGEREVQKFEPLPEPPPEPELAPPVAGAPAPGNARAAPAFAGKDLDGKEITLASLKGQVVVLDFWATWCGPCLAAMPSIQTVADTFKDKPVAVLGVNLDQPGLEQKVRKVLADKKNSMRQVMDPQGQIGRAYGAQAIPLVVVIDREGRLRHTHVGFSPRGDEVIAREVKALLEEKPSP